MVQITVLLFTTTSNFRTPITDGMMYDVLVNITNEAKPIT